MFFNDLVFIYSTFEEKEKQSILTIIDMALAMKRFKDDLLQFLID